MDYRLGTEERRPTLRRTPFSPLSQLAIVSASPATGRASWQP